MLFWLESLLHDAWGPFRLLASHALMISCGALFGGMAVWLGIPRLWHLLPRDRGRAHTPTAAAAIGKPTGGGILICLCLLPVLLFVLPFSAQHWAAVGCLVLAMLLGYLDDRSDLPWGQMRKGLLDGGVALMAALVLSGGRSVEMWFPVVKQTLVIHPVIYIPLAAILLWVSMNATNCSDGVDGLAGTLTLLSLFSLGIFLYGVVGHEKIAQYLLVPHNPQGARWAVLLFCVAGGVAGYLWHNAEPSRVLMGDAGSHLLGLLVGMAVLASGNPFVILVVAPVVLVNGGTGLVKLALLRMLKRVGFDTSPPPENGAQGDDAEENNQHVIVRALHTVRFPLHDHFRKNLGWSNAQVLLRFLLIQSFLTPLLFVLLVKVR